MPSIMPTGKQQYTNNAGVPLAGGRVYTFDAGTTTPKATFQDAAGTVENPNPIVLNARGEALAFWDGAYDVKVTDANGVTIYTVSNYQSPLTSVELTSDQGTDLVKGTWFGGLKEYVSALGTFLGTSLIGFVQSGADARPRSAQEKLRERISVEDFGAAGNGVANDTAAINAALAACKVVYFAPGAVYKADTITINKPGQTVYLNGALLNLAQMVINADNVTVDLGGGEIRGPLHVGKLAIQAAPGQNKLVFEDASQFVVGDEIWCSYGDNGENFPIYTPTAITAINGNTVTVAANLLGTVPIPVGMYIGTFSWGTLIDQGTSKNLRFVGGKITNGQGYFMSIWRWKEADFATNIPSVICDRIDFSGNGLDQFLFVKAHAKFIDCTFGITYDVAKTGIVYGDDADIQLVRCHMARGNFDSDFTPISDAGRKTFFQGSAGRVSAVDCHFDGANKNPSAAYFNGNTLHAITFNSGGAPHDGAAGSPSVARFAIFSFARTRFENYSRSVFSTTVAADPYALLADSVEFNDCQIGTQLFQLKSLESVTIRNFSFNGCRIFAGGPSSVMQAQNPQFVARLNSCSLKLNGAAPELTACEVNNSTIYDSNTIQADSSARFNMVRLQNTAIRTSALFGYTQFSGTFIIDNPRFNGTTGNLTDMDIMTLQNGQGAGIRVRSANGSLWYDVATNGGVAFLIPELSLSWFDGRITGLYGDDWILGAMQNVRQSFGGQYKATYSLGSTTSGSSEAGSTAIAVTTVSYVTNRPVSGDRIFIQTSDHKVFVTTVAPGYADNSLVIPLVEPLPASVNAGTGVWFVRLVAL